MDERRIVRSLADSLSRLSKTREQVASSSDHSKVASQLKDLSKPNSPSSALRKAGVALIVATPDPITAVPGVALIASSYAVKRNEPTKLDDLAAETRKMLRDIQSLSL
jgi:hypothetical protein